MGSALLWDIWQQRVVIPDVSGQPIDPIFKGQQVKENTTQMTTDKESFLGTSSII